MVVHADRMRENLELTHGALFSQRVLLALVAGGMHARRRLPDRRRSSRSAPGTSGTPLRDAAGRGGALGLDLDEVFDLAHYTRYAAEIVGRLDADSERG